MRKHRKLIAMAVACACAPLAHADVIDINAMVVNQLKKANKLDGIYRSVSGGQALPAGLNASAVFEGNVGGRGVVFSVPSVIPERPLVLANKPINNCSSSPVTFKATVNKESSNSTTIANSDTVASSREISVTVGYESPFGASASSTATASQSFSATTSKEQSYSDKLGWQDELEVPVGPGKQVKVQFVVTEQRLDRVPYTANLVLSGPVSINFLRGQEGFQWVKVAGNQLPPNVIRPGVQQNGRKLAVCRVTVGDKVVIGKSEGTTCWYALPVMLPIGVRMGTSTANFDILVGAESSVQLGDPYVTDAYTTDDASRSKVCFAQTDQGWSLPGYIIGRDCVAEWDSRAVTTQKYKVLRAAATGGLTARVNLDDHLALAQRTFDLRGIFTGVNAVSGDFKIGQDEPAANCTKAVAAATTAGPSALGAGVKLGPPVMMPVALDAAPKGEPVLQAASVKKVKPRR